MVRRCDRPLCSDLAAVAYGFDAGCLLVWLDALVDDDRARAGALCARHGQRLIAPKGWWLDDRRVEVPELFHGDDEPPVPAPTKVPAGPRRRRRKPAPVEPVVVAEAARPQPDDLVSFTGFDPEEAPVVAAGPVLVEEAIVVGDDGPDVVSGSVVIEGSIVVEDPGEPNPLLEPSTPLLARAFSGVARPDRPHHRSRRNGTAGDAPADPAP